MKFDHISELLSAKEIANAKCEFDCIMTDLGVRHNNYHCGTGLGGDNLLLISMMSLKHSLISKHIKVELHGNTVVWGAKWLAKADHKKIRTKLDKLFLSLPEKDKYLAIVISDCNTSKNMFRLVTERKEQFPNLFKAISCKPYKFDKNLSSIEQLIFAFIACQDLSNRLDKQDYSTIQTTGSLLYDFSPEIILVSIRYYVGIERLVKYNLDEDPVFDKTLRKVTQHVN